MNKDDFRSRLLNAESNEEIVKLFAEEEAHFLEL
jgi:mannitol/fructose-specific phosphotransferase system IIA component (Ntr-type)